MFEVGILKRQLLQTAINPVEILAHEKLSQCNHNWSLKFTSVGLKMSSPGTTSCGSSETEKTPGFIREKV